MHHSSKYQIDVMAVVLAALVFMAGNTWAQARKTSVNCTVDDTGTIKVSYKVSGVGNEDLCVVSTTSFTANCACQNNGGNCPSDAKKQTTETPVAAGNIAEPRNGQINGTQTLTAPTDAACEAELNCPGTHQDPILASYDTGNVALQVYAQFNTLGQNGCTLACCGIGTPIRTGTCTTSDSETLDEDCALLF
jgi:hypothetical protein